MFEYSKIKKQLNIEVSKNGNEIPAFVTHYLQNRNNGASKKFIKHAYNYIRNSPATIIDSGKNGCSVESLLSRDTEISWNVPFPPPKEPKFTFIDLFAGIGGFRIAMQNLGGKCVFTSEIDYHAKKTYELNFGEIPFGDITKQETKDSIPEKFDLLCAGFPCQPFSQAGFKKGFDDTRGTLFFDIATIIRKHKPKAFFLENVKGLMNHKSGRTLTRILEVLQGELNYFVPIPKIINARDFGVPQNRERIFIVGFRKDLKINEFTYPKPQKRTVSFGDVKEKEIVDTKYYLSKRYYETLIEHKRRHASKGNGFGYEVIKDHEIANAIIVGGMGKERNLVIDKRIVDFTPTTHIKGDVNRLGVRKMTPREWARLQGFPDKFIINGVADVHAYKQFGNSVAIPAIETTAVQILKYLGVENAKG